MTHSVKSTSIHTGRAPWLYSSVASFMTSVWPEVGATAQVQLAGPASPFG